MGVEWQSRDFLTDWTGLFNRLQNVDVPPSYMRTARNIDFWGSAIGKRQGTQLVNGWGTLATGTWTVSGGTNLTGTVADASGFQVGDFVIFVNPAGGPITSATLSAVSGSTVSFTGWTGVTPPVAGQTAVVARRELGGRIDGLYHAVFRNGDSQLLAAVNGRIWNLYNKPAGSSWVPGLVNQNYPTLSVPTTWPSTTSGTFNVYDTLVAVDGSTHQGPPLTSAAPPDIIQIISPGPTPPAGTVIYEGTIAKFTGGLPVLTAAASVAPPSGSTVILFPHAYSGDTRFTMFNNRVYVTQVGARNPVGSGPGAQVNQRQPPTVIEQTNVLDLTTGKLTMSQRRMGIRAPTRLSTPTTATGSGVLSGTYFYRWTYVNTSNGQESEGGPEATISGLSSNAVLFPVWQSPDPGVTGINLYRSLSGQDGTWYLVPSVTSIASGLVEAMPVPNLSDNLIDNTPDASLGTLLKTFMNEPPPDTITYFAVWTGAGALIAIDSGSIAEGGEQVSWSDAPDIVNGVYKLESWPINNTLFVNRDDGDKLISLGVFFDSVAVWKGRSMHRIVGAPPDIILQPISFRDDHTGVGIWSAKGFIMDTDIAVFVSDDGFYQVSRYEGVQQGFTSTRISRAIDQEFYYRTGYSYSAQRANRELSHLLYHRVRRRLHAFLPIDGNANPTDSFIYQAEGTVDGTPHGWALWSVPIDYRSTGNPGAVGNWVSASCMVNDPMGIDHPHYGCGAYGIVVMADIGAGEWQSLPVTITSDTVWFSGGGAGSVCRSRAVDFVFSPQAGMPAPILRFATDYGTPDRYQLPALVTLGQSANVNPLILELGQYMSVGLEETSVTGLFLVQDFTLWFQKLPVGVTPRLIPVQL